MSTPSYAPRAHYGAALEPTGTVLHGAGQSHEAFAEYVAAVGPSRAPAVYMWYMGLRKGVGERMGQLRNCLADYPDLQLCPQIGLSMAHDGQPEKHYEHRVAAGEFDAQIDELIEALATIPRPIFLRIGYEFNGHWNGYERATFAPAYRRVAERIKAANLSHVALLWCFAVDGSDKQYMPYYPGDDVVDWWSVDLFSVEHLTHDATYAFLADADKHQRPVFVGESTPRYVGVQDGEASWQRWYAPFFKLIHDHPGMKGLSYINWEWSSFPQWHNWGDGRIQANDIVRQHYLAEMSLPLYQHGPWVR